MADAKITNGPDKPALQWSVAYPERGQRVEFIVADEPVSAQIVRMEERGDDGLAFSLEGTVESGPHSGKPFSALYHVGSREGTLSIP